jgi:hypothetical protein
MVDYEKALSAVKTADEYEGFNYRRDAFADLEKHADAIRSALELARKVQSEIPATPLPEGMTRDLFADIKRIIADNERLKWRLAKYELPAAQTGERE